MSVFNVLSKSSRYISFTSRIRSGQKNDEKLSISPDEILSEAHRKKCIRLLNPNENTNYFPSKNVKKAAVLVPLCKVDNELALLYTERALQLKVNGGEIAFPGGMFEESDRTLENTALREAYEEIGLMPNDVDVWGKGPEINRPNVNVTPVLGYIDQLRELKLNNNEVASVFTVTLENLSSSTNFRVTRFRSNKSYFVTPVYLGGEKRIWGLTAYITHLVLSSLIPDIYKKNITFVPRIEKVIN